MSCTAGLKYMYLRAWGEIMGQSVLIMIDPIISPRTRSLLFVLIKRMRQASAGLRLASHTIQSAPALLQRC
jgi:hypothetical protein